VIFIILYSARLRIKAQLIIEADLEMFSVSISAQFIKIEIYE